jgi:hypothetical protein
MAFDLCSDVTLTRDVVDRGLRAGDVGTVVERHVVPGVAEEGYASAVRLPTLTDRPAVLSEVLVGAQRHGRIHAACATRGKIARQNADGDQRERHRAEHDTVRRVDLI